MIVGGVVVARTETHRDIAFGSHAPPSTDLDQPRPCPMTTATSRGVADHPQILDSTAAWDTPAHGRPLVGFEHCELRYLNGTHASATSI